MIANYSRGATLFAVLVALLTLIVFVWMWRTATTSDPIEARVRQYSGELEARNSKRGGRGRGSKRRREGGAASGLARKLSQADLPVTAS